jgi:hypothetical protein
MACLDGSAGVRRPPVETVFGVSWRRFVAAILSWYDSGYSRTIEIVFDKCFLLSEASPIVVRVFDRTPVRTIE